MNTMKVTVTGPEHARLKDWKRGDVHIHVAGCKDVNKQDRPKEYEFENRTKNQIVAEIIGDIYEGQIGDRLWEQGINLDELTGDKADEAWEQACLAYAEEPGTLYIAPCVKGV